DENLYCVPAFPPSPGAGPGPRAPKARVPRPKMQRGGFPQGTRPQEFPRRLPTLLVSSIRLEVTHLVEPAFFLLLRFAGHPLPLFDQLADLLSALVADLRIELGTARGADRLAALLRSEERRV